MGDTVPVKRNKPGWSYVIVVSCFVVFMEIICVLPNRDICCCLKETGREVKEEGRHEQKR
jgi:hypothetical protein